MVPQIKRQILKVGLFRGHLPLSRGHISPLVEKTFDVDMTIPKLEEKGDALHTKALER